MAKRGIYKKGYYLALIYALNEHYALESLRCGADPAAWRPLPRRRADQFLNLILDSLSEVGVVLPSHYTALMSVLEREKLPFVKQVLDFCVTWQVTKLARQRQLAFDLTRASLADLRAFTHLPVATTETHPQVRKLVQSVTPGLDALWLEALLKLEACPRRWPRVSVILGGLPPSFEVVHRQVSSGLAVSSYAEAGRELNVMQFYSLATGAVPDPVGSWRNVPEQLARLSEAEVYLLKSLSRRQAGHLSGLSREAFLLVLSLRSIRRATRTWREVVEKLRGPWPSRSLEARRQLNHWKVAYNLDIQQLEVLRKLLRADAWQQVKAFDEELIRLIDKGELSLELFMRLKSWDQPTWLRVLRVLQNDWLWITSYLEDSRALAHFEGLRSPARLELGSLFPKTVTWLNGLVRSNLEAVLARELEPVTEYALEYSDLVKDQLYGLAKPTAQV